MRVGVPGASRLSASPLRPEAQQVRYRGPPTLSVRDVQVPIVDSNFSPREASSTMKRLLRKREVTETGVPWAFECPLTLEVMEDPVVAADGNTYERYAIEEWFEKSNGAPVMGFSEYGSVDGEQGGGGADFGTRTRSDAESTDSTQLRPNYRLREEISAYRKAKAFLSKQDAMRKQKQKRKQKNQQ